FDVPFEDYNSELLTPGQSYRRLIGRARMYYRPDDLGAAASDAKALLPLGTQESLMVPGCTYNLAVTLGLISQTYKRLGSDLLPAPGNVFGSVGPDGGGYVDLDGNGSWWIPAGRVYYDVAVPSFPKEISEARQRFFLPRRFEDPFGNVTIIDYDSDLLLV